MTCFFIDGNHAFEAVLKDYEQWSPLLRDGGVIAFHDVVMGTDPDPAGPAMVAKEYIFDSPLWTEVKLVDSLLVARKIPKQVQNLVFEPGYFLTVQFHRKTKVKGESFKCRGAFKQ